MSEFTNAQKIMAETPLLMAELGKHHKAKVDRIRFALTHGQPLKRTNRARVSKNRYQTLIQIMPRQHKSAIDDIVVGVSRLDFDSRSDNTSSKPLSTQRLYALMQCLDEFCSASIARMLDVETRQAQRYLLAVKIISLQLDRHFRYSDPMKEIADEMIIEDLLVGAQ